MGRPVVVATAGGLPVIHTDGRGARITIAANGLGLLVTPVTNNLGLPVTFVDASGVITEPAPPTAPSYVNVGTQVGATATALTLTLPGSRVNGNLLVAMFSANSPTSADVTWPAGWTKIDTSGGSGSPLASWAYRYVNGSETAPNITWTGTATARGVIAQLTGVRSTLPIGHTTKNFQATTSAVTCPELVPQSGVSLGLAFFNAGNAITPSGWTSHFNIATTGIRQQGFSKVLGNVGVGSGAFTATTGAVSNVTTMLAEIKRLGA